MVDEETLFSFCANGSRCRGWNTADGSTFLWFVVFGFWFVIVDVFVFLYCCVVLCVVLCFVL